MGLPTLESSAVIHVLRPVDLHVLERRLDHDLEGNCWVVVGL